MVFMVLASWGTNCQLPFKRVQYEGRSICNENSPVYPKVLYLHTL